MANLVIDSFSASSKGDVLATVSGGIAPYYHSLNGATPTLAKEVNLGAYGSFWSVEYTGLPYASYNLIVTDSSNPKQSAEKYFKSAPMLVAPGCLYSGPGNLQGIIQVDYDKSIIDNIQISGPNGYSENSATIPQLSDFAIFVFLANGLYLVSGRDSDGNVLYSETTEFICANSEPLTIFSVNTTDATSKTLADGSAIAAITYGVQFGPTIVVQTSLDGIVWANATNPAINTYSASYPALKQGAYKLRARVMDLGTGVETGETAEYNFTVEYTKVYGCTNPNATNYNPNATDDDGSCALPDIVPKSHFVVPMMNSLRFVDMVAAATQPPTMDNRLYCAETWQGISRPPYYQKITRDDVITTQFQSNYNSHTISLVNYQNGNTVATFPAVKKKQNLGVHIQYPAFIAAHPADTTQSRVYFNSGALPLAFVSGDRITVLNATPAALNKEYTVKGIGFDSTQSVPFIIINLPYPSTAPIPPRINIVAQTDYDILSYDVFEVSTDWGTQPNGVYYIKIEAELTGKAYVFDAVLFKSEPFSLFPEHEGTNLINWRNFDDAQDLMFSTGLNCGIRVESEIWQRFPGGTRKTYRGPDSKLIKLSAMPQRKVKFNTFWLPPWLHEKLAIAFDFDHVEINGEEFQSEDGYAEPQYISRYAFSNSSITLEKVVSVDNNSDDIGDVNGVAPFIVVNEKFLQI